MRIRSLEQRVKSDAEKKAKIEKKLGMEGDIPELPISVKIASTEAVHWLGLRVDTDASML